MTGTVYICLHTNQSRSYLNHLVDACVFSADCVAVKCGLLTKHREWKENVKSRPSALTLPCALLP